MVNTCCYGLEAKLILSHTYIMKNLYFYLFLVKISIWWSYLPHKINFYFIATTFFPTAAVAYNTLIPNKALVGRLQYSSAWILFWKNFFFFALAISYGVILNPCYCTWSCRSVDAALITPPYRCDCYTNRISFWNKSTILIFSCF